MHIVSCFVWLKSVLLNVCVFLVFYQNAGSQLSFRFFSIKGKLKLYIKTQSDAINWFQIPPPKKKQQQQNKQKQQQTNKKPKTTTQQQQTNKQTNLLKVRVQLCLRSKVSDFSSWAPSFWLGSFFACAILMQCSCGVDLSWSLIPFYLKAVSYTHLTLPTRRTV